MRIESISWDGSGPGELAARLREAVPEPGRLAGDVAELVEAVRTGGDDALLALITEHDGNAPESISVPRETWRAALEGLDDGLHRALHLAASNIEAAARAQLAGEPVAIGLPQGHRVSSRELAVGAAGIYVPGGRAPYPSTVLMGVTAARVAGVERVCVASPPDESGRPDDAVLAAADIAGADEVFAMGGAQAIAALAYGTGSVAPVDVIAGPGGPWVQEAKLAVSRRVGIDGYAGPSELVAVADRSAPSEWVALDVCAQAEHGADGLLVVIAAGDGTAAAVTADLERLAPERPSVSSAPVTVVEAPSLPAAVELADQLAPEHLELACEDARSLAGSVKRAGCVLVGPHGATAFADYAAGSNHVLPTGGAGRFSGPLGPGTFRRRISVVEIDGAAAGDLAPIVAEIAAAEGFPVHGESAVARGVPPGELGS